MQSSLKVHFWLYKSKKNKKGLAPIYIRITMNNSKSEIASGYFIAPNQWNKKKNQAFESSPETIEVNQGLLVKKAKVLALYNQLLSSGKPFSVDVIKDRLLGKESQDTLLRATKYYIDKIAGLVNKSYSQGTLNNYIYFQKKLEGFSKSVLKANDIPLDQLNYKFINEFAHYLKTVENNKQNTVAKNITLLKAIINTALDMEWITVNPFRNFRIKKEEPPRTYLTIEEVNKVITTRMPNRNLEIIKDCILFQIYTGVAYADLKNLKESNIITGIDGQPWIELRRQKTNSRVALPILPPALEIIQKYANHKCRLTDHLILPVQSNQKMNKQIKKIMNVCGIEKNISTHSFRRTFATTITLSNGVPIETVSKMLGHSDLKTTQIYAKVVDSKISSDMSKLITNQMQKAT